MTSKQDDLIPDEFAPLIKASDNLLKDLEYLLDQAQEISDAVLRAKTESVPDEETMDYLQERLYIIEESIKDIPSLLEEVDNAAQDALEAPED